MPSRILSVWLRVSHTIPSVGHMTVCVTNGKWQMACAKRLPRAKRKRVISNDTCLEWQRMRHLKGYVCRVVKTQGMPYLYRFFRTRALWLVALLQKMTCKLRHPVGLRHPILVSNYTRSWHIDMCVWQRTLYLPMVAMGGRFGHFEHSRYLERDLCVFKIDLYVLKEPYEHFEHGN